MTTPPSDLTPDIDQAQVFLNLLGGRSYNFATYREGKNAADKDLTRSERPGTFQACLPWLIERTNKPTPYGAWVNFQEAGDSKASPRIRCVVAELNNSPTRDEFSSADQGYFPLRPSAKIQTAPNEFHYLFLLSDKESLTAVEYEAIAKRLRKQYAALPDTSTPHRVRRIPGFYNRKPELAEPFQVTLCSTLGARYSKLDLLTAFPELSPEEAAGDSFQVPRYGDGNVSRFYDAVKRIDPSTDENIELVGRALHLEGDGGQKAQLMWVLWIKDPKLKDLWAEKWSSFSVPPLNRPTPNGADIFILAGSLLDDTPGGEIKVPFKDGENKKPERTIENLQLYLKAMNVELKRNIFSGNSEIHRDGRIEPFEDDAVLILRQDAETRGFKMSKEDFIEKLKFLALKTKYHPVREYLEGLNYEPSAAAVNIDTWLIRFAGVEDTPLNRAISRKVLIAAVRRVRKPGCYFHAVLILEGPQGYGKSGLVEVMASTPWYSNCLKIGSDAKRTVEHTQGKWIIESAELLGMTPKQVEEIKNWTTTTVDRTRISYKEWDKDYPRQFICIGTTNNPRYLTDRTGNRRFWPVKLTRPVDFVGLKASRDALWAEAAAYEAKGESLDLPADLYTESLEVAETRVNITIIGEEVDIVVGEQYGWISVTELFKFIHPHSSPKAAWMVKELSELMAKKGFAVKKKRPPGARRESSPLSCYVKTGPDGLDDLSKLPKLTLYTLNEEPTYHPPAEKLQAEKLNGETTKPTSAELISNLLRTATGGA